MEGTTGSNNRSNKPIDLSYSTMVPLENLSAKIEAQSQFFGILLQKLSTRPRFTLVSARQTIKGL